MEREPDKILAFVSQMPILYGGEAEAASSYVCPMHSEVSHTESSSCPKCGRKLVPADKIPGAGEASTSIMITASTSLTSRAATSTLMTTPMDSNGKT
jgi:Heavy metal binding domain